jgi:hypothetical protein
LSTIRSCTIYGKRELVRGSVVAERMENEEIRRDEQPSSLPQDEANVSIPLAFHHPSGRYRKMAVVAAVVVAFGSFFLSMRGEGEPDYELMGWGSAGCCSLLNLAIIMEAVYNYKWLQYNELHGLEEKNLKSNFMAAVLLAIFGLTILFGNLLSEY